MKLTYPPLLAAHNMGFLQHLLFGLTSVCVSVKVLCSHKDLEQRSTKQKSCGKSFKIVLVLSYSRMPRKLQLRILQRIAHCIIKFKNVSVVSLKLLYETITKWFSVKDSVHSCTWNVSRLSESEKTLACGSSRDNIPRAWMKLSCTENNLVFL